MASQGGPKYTLSQQPWAQPGISHFTVWDFPVRMSVNLHLYSHALTAWSWFPTPAVV